jgi:putative heme iron utilization protein
MEADHPFTARCLLRAASAATLATQQEGQPFASLVTHAVAPDGSVLLFLSMLSQHTRHLVAEPRCSLMAVGAAPGPNPQTAPRVTITGLAEQADDPALKARWLARHPYAAQYAEFGDFALWRIQPVQALLVAGFAAAHRLRQADYRPDPAAVAAIAAAEPGVIAHMNDDHRDAMAAIAGDARDWRMVGLDVDGCDLAAGEATFRLGFSAPVGDTGAVRRELVEAARRARTS